MKIKNINISNFRCFHNINLVLGNISVFIGHNNSGKTSVLKSILYLQQGVAANAHDVRVGLSRASIALTCSDVSFYHDRTVEPSIDAAITIDVTVDQTRRGFGLGINLSQGNGATQINQYPNTSPNNCLVPYLSRRKVGAYNEDVKQENAISIGDMSKLPAKLARISNPTFPGHEEFKESCISILGFMLTAVTSEIGQKPGIYLPDGSVIPIDVMGEGVPNVVSMLVELITAKGKIFVIEEPENDLHPLALKSLLKLILKSSENNQIIVSTHSSIVAQYLGIDKDSLFYVRQTSTSPPTSEVEQIDSTPKARMNVLRELGYSLSDFELWDGWLILEESSAERIIRDYLIPFFAPVLSRIRTLAANGVDDVEPVFNDFHRLVRFNHLEQAYREVTWVKVDGDSAGEAIVDRLRASYSEWSPQSFGQFNQPQFERYYPKNFEAKVHEIFSIENRKLRKAAKKDLLLEVLAWLNEDRERAKVALEESASEVIQFLKDIEKRFL